jgi:rod shape-determining protein MreC
MFSLLQRYRDILIVGVLLLYPLGQYLSTGHKGREPNLVDRGILMVAAPVQSGLTWVVDGVAGSVNGYVALRGSHEEARELRERLAEAHAELNALKESEAENARLKALLGYVEGSVEPEIPAKVVGLNPSAQFVSVRINRGEDQSVHTGMPVVTPEGVMGQVVRAVGGSADVMLICDPWSRMGVIIRRTRLRATAVGAGDGKPLTLENVTRDSDLVDGDEVLTSGTDGIFPQGLKVGRVENVQRGLPGLFLTANVAPSVNVRKVEEVLVVPVAPLALLPKGKGR